MNRMTNKEQLLKYLKARKQMVLATYGVVPWACTVYYAVDDSFNLFFISTPDTQHCIDIEVNSNVACAVADTGQEFTDKKIGVQIQGTAERLGILESVKVLTLMYKVLRPGAKDIMSFESFKKSVLERKAYKIRPTRIKFFNEEIYGEFGSEFFEFE